MTMMLLPNVLFTLLFTQSTHPLAMTIIIIFQTLAMCIMMSLMTSNSWISYILFLVFLGGMLVLFLYITSLASNELFSNNTNFNTSTLLFLITLMGFLLFFFNMDLMTWHMLTSNIDNHPLTTDMHPKYEEPLSYTLMKLYANHSGKISLTLMIYLLLSLLVVVYINNTFVGPLRSNSTK
nr:NADH dehydrogenase subunit 6 [Phyllozelus siccus siccus]